MRAVMVDIIEAVMRNRYEKPETRELMLKINPEGKHDDANEVRKRGNMRQEQEDQLYMYEKPEMRAVMVDITDAASVRRCRAQHGVRG
jgi:hypothetical protein